MTDYAALALKLKPYILQWVVGTGTGGASGGGSVGAHALSGAQHTGQLAQSQATWAATNAALNAHALNANAHHAQIHGLDSTNHTGTLAWSKVNKTGSDLAHLQTRAHSSLTGVTANQHHNQQHDITGSDHTIGGAPWDVVGKTAAGELGLIASLADVSGGQSVLLRSNAGLLTVKQATASERLRTPLLDTASGNLTIQPAGDLLLSPGGNDAMVPVGTSLRSNNFLAGFPLAGFRIGPTAIAGQSGMQAGSGEFDELRARIFVADETRVDRGQEYITKSYGVLSRAFTAPASVGAAAHLYVENSPHIAGAVFSNNDWVLLRYLDMSSGIVLTSVWGQVSAYNVTGLTGEQRWTFTLRQGTGSLVFATGAMVVCFGASGQGYILSDAITATSPFIQIGKWTTNPYAPGNRTVLTQVGRLDGVGFTGEYGIAASVNGFGANNPWLKASTGGVAVNNADATWTYGGERVVSISPSTGLNVNVRDDGFAHVAGYRFTRPTGALVGGWWVHRNATVDQLNGALSLNTDAFQSAAVSKSSLLVIRAMRNNTSGASAELVLAANGSSGGGGAELRLSSTYSGSPLVTITGNIDATYSSMGLANLTAWGGVYIADGSAGAPSLAFSGDTNTGIYRPSADRLALVTGGAESLVATGGGVIVPSGAYADRVTIGTMTVGWRRVGRFATGGGYGSNRGLVKLTVLNSGGTTPWFVEIDAFHSWTTGTSSLRVRDCVTSAISAVRITNDGTYAYVECNFASAPADIYYQLETTGAANGFTLYTSPVSGGGTVECHTTAARGMSVATSSTSSVSHFEHLSALGSIDAGTTIQAAAGSWGTGYRFSNSNYGILSHANYLVIEQAGAAVLNLRIDNSDSSLRLGYANPYDRSAFIDFHTYGASSTSARFRLVRSPGANGSANLMNYGTGSMLYRQMNLGSHIWEVNSSEAMRLDTSSRLIVGKSVHAAGDAGGVAGTVALTAITNSTVSTGVGNVRMTGTTARTNTHWLKLYIGTTAVYVPAWTQLA